MKFKIIFATLLVGAMSCTDLNEELRQDLTTEQGQKLQDATSFLSAAYNGMKGPYMDQARLWAAQQHTTDETVGPTRGGDWDDNGIWRSLHAHSWTPEHDFLSQTFNDLLQIVFLTTNMLQFKPTPQQEAEARFLRAHVMLTVLDGWGQVPYREAGSDLLLDAQVLGPQAAVDFVIKEVDQIIGNLPDGVANRANKNAAKFLKMKALLNKGTYLNRAAPAFSAADMQAVVALADDIIGSGKYQVSEKYFDNFEPANDKVSKENIFTLENVGGSNSGNIRSRWFCTLHYNQNPSGWNGFTTLSDFYNKFEDSDIRKSSAYPGMTDVSGIKAGFLRGQQYDQTGKELKDRKDNPLAFTDAVALKETGDNLEVTGIRVVKYPIDYKSGDNVDNDAVLYRYSDLLLMKAEALLRSGSAGAALTIVNDLRAKRGASAFADLNVDNLLAERGRELYWEGHRRSDLIRFGKFLEPTQLKAKSGAERLLFPIPAKSLASNPNLKQNPGY
jgi:starch-binding outer membrane protein, SusD/RagB family